MTDLFGSEGLFKKKLPNFECRPQQEILAEAVRDLLDSEGTSVLAAEAPPGVGKTFALLAPAIEWAEREGTSIIFLTSSIPLQEQLINKDLPILSEILGVAPSFGLIKGRGNYVCLRKAEELGAGGLLLSFDDGGDASKKILEWIEKTDDGDLSSLPISPGHPVREKISASFKGCLGTNCPYRDLCFVQKALKSAAKWRVIVSNYHLYFSYALGKMGSFPVPAQLIICDEAHRMAEAACSVSSVSSKKDDWLSAVKRLPALSLDNSILKAIDYDSAAMDENLRGLGDRVSRFFELLQIRVPKKGLFIDPPEDLVREGTLLMQEAYSLGKSARKLKNYISDLDDPEDLMEEAAPFLLWNDEMEELIASMDWCLKVEDYPNWAYWKEDDAIVSSPSTCGDILPAAFDDDSIERVVAVSATLALDGDFTYWSRETGLVPDKSLLLDSPFNMKEQASLLVVDLGLPVRDRNYDDRVCRVVRKLCKDNRGSSLVLLSSTRLLRKVGSYLAKSNDGYRVLVQGDLPRSELLRLFREDENSVLVGTVSFREGVDVPGDSLTQVIIDRIPFAHPDDPLQLARKELEGSSSFVKNVLPAAKMQLRQAFGRLVRSANDGGKVVILDSRVIARRDWKVLETLPSVPVKKIRVVDRPVAPVDSV